MASALKSNIRHLLKNDFDYSDEIGGYRKLTKKIADSLVEKIKPQPPEPLNSTYPTSKTNIRYLKKMIALCNIYGKKVILIRSPQHPGLKIRSNENHFQQVKREHFDKLPFLDFNDFPVENEYFADFEHLNDNGARIFSLRFKDILENELLP
jgi:hypothetical protein